MQIFSFTPFVLHSVAICNDCFPICGQISAAAPQGFPQCGIYTSLQSGMHAASVLMCNMKK